MAIAPASVQGATEQQPSAARQQGQWPEAGAMGRQAAVAVAKGGAELSREGGIITYEEGSFVWDPLEEQWDVM